MLVSSYAVAVGVGRANSKIQRWTTRPMRKIEQAVVARPAVCVLLIDIWRLHFNSMPDMAAWYTDYKAGSSRVQDGMLDSKLDDMDAAGLALS